VDGEYGFSFTFPEFFDLSSYAVGDTVTIRSTAVGSPALFAYEIDW